MLPPSHPAGSRARIARPELAERLRTALDSGAAVLVADAGFGKTSALEEALSDGRPAAWVRCTVGDREPGRLLIRLMGAVRAAVPGAVDVLGERLVAGLGPVDPLAAGRELLAEVGRLVVEPLTLVLDDAERLAGGAESLPLVEEMLTAGPALRIAIASRRPLGVKTAKLRATGRLTVLGTDDLAFSEAECARFLAERWGREPAPAEVEEVMLATQGWPLGLELHLFGAGTTGPGSGSREAAFAFLGEEVLEGLAPDLRRALLAAAVPPELTPAMAERLNLPAGFIGEAQEAGLFLRESEGAHVFHPLFREFLLERLDAELTQAECRELRARVAGALTAAGRRADAVEQWIEAEAWEQALEAITDGRSAFVRTAPDSLSRWLERLPAEIRTDPRARLVEGELALAEGRYDHAVAPLEEAARTAAGRLGPAAVWETRYLLADTLTMVSRLDDAIPLAEGFDEGGGLRAGPSAPAVAMLAAFALADKSRFEEADAVVRRAEAHPDGGGVVPLSRIHRAVYHEMPAGRVREALELCREATAALAVPEDLALAGWAQAAIHETMGMEGRALEAWAGVELLAREAGLAGYYGYEAQVNRARIHSAAGRLAEAEAELARAGHRGESGFTVWHLHTARAGIAAVRGELEQAAAAAELALDSLPGGPLPDRVLAPLAAVPVLVAAGCPSRAGGVLEETLALCETSWPQASFLRARLLAQRAWVAAGQGDWEAATAGLARAVAEAPAAAEHLIRAEWSRVGPLLHSALEAGVLEPEPTVRAIEAAWPGGGALVAYIGHPRAAVRRAAIAPAASSGHPEAVSGLEELVEDHEPRVAAAAAEALGRLRRDPPALRFRLFGGFTVERGSWRPDDAVWERRIAQRLVRLLLVHRGRFASEDEIFDAFWPGKAPGTARPSLQVAVSRARAVLDVPGAESVIVAAERSYRLRLREQDSVDVDQFEQAAVTALADTGPARIRLLDRAAGLWEGEPLPEERYSDWAISWRERLTDRYAGVLAALAEAHLTAGEHAAGAARAKELVELDPLNEAGHRTLMLAYAREGRRSHALRQFLECRRMLVDELGVEPAIETSRLQQRILAGDPV